MPFTPSDWIAVLAVLTTGAVAWIAHLDRRGDRDSAADLAREARAHDRNLAREARLQKRRATVYRDMLEMVLRVLDGVNQTDPILVLNPPPPPIEQPSLDAQRAMVARVATLGSAEVVAAFERVASASREFYHAVWYWHQLTPEPGVRPPAGSADELRRAHDDVETKRAEVRAAVDALEEVARSELGA